MEFEAESAIYLPRLSAKRAVAFLFQNKDTLERFHLVTKQLLPPHSGVFCDDEAIKLERCIETGIQQHHLKTNLSKSWYFVGKVTDCPVNFQPVSLYETEDQIADAANDVLWVHDTHEGLVSLCLYAWLCATAERDEMAKIGAIQSWSIQSAYKKGLTAALGKLCACVGEKKQISDSDIHKIDEVLEPCVSSFLENSRSEWQGLATYPVDDYELSRLATEIPKNFKLLPSSLRKSKDILDWELVGRLFGYSAQGTPLVENFAEEYVRATHASDCIFTGVWSKSNAFYYHFPLVWLMENLPSLLQSKREEAKAQYSDAKQQLAVGKPIHIYSTDLVEIMEALQDFERRYKELIEKRLRWEFYRFAYEDATKGQLYGLLRLRLQQVQEEIIRVRNRLNLNSNENPGASEWKTVDWTHEPAYMVRQEIEQAQQSIDEWTAESFAAVVARQCPLSCLNHGLLRPELTVLIRCEASEQPRFTAMEFKSGGKARWRFDPALPKGVATVLSVVPILYFREGRA